MSLPHNLGHDRSHPVPHHARLTIRDIARDLNQPDSFIQMAEAMYVVFTDYGMTRTCPTGLTCTARPYDQIDVRPV